MKCTVKNYKLYNIKWLNYIALSQYIAVIFSMNSMFIKRKKLMRFSCFDPTCDPKIWPWCAKYPSSVQIGDPVKYTMSYYSYQHIWGNN